MNERQQIALDHPCRTNQDASHGRFKILQDGSFMSVLTVNLSNDPDAENYASWQSSVSVLYKGNPTPVEKWTRSAIAHAMAIASGWLEGVGFGDLVAPRPAPGDICWNFFRRLSDNELLRVDEPSPN